MRFVFLLYVSRSGSTLLARLLAERYADLIALPEFRMVEHFMAAGEKRVHRMRAEDIFKLMKLDHQRHNLNISDEELRSIAKQAAGKGTKQVIESLVSKFSQKTGGMTAPNVAMIKLGALSHMVPTISEIFDGSKFVHIIRDPRGVINSQMNNNRPYFPEEKMGRGDAFYAAKRWRYYIKKINILKRSMYPIQEVYYENLINDPENQLYRLKNYLELDNDPNISQNRKFLFAKGKEAQIHRLVEKDPIKKRIDAWQTELKASEGYAVELLAGLAMKKKGYEKYFSNRISKINKIINIIGIWCEHIVRSIQYMARRAHYYNVNRNAAISRIKIMLQRIKNSIYLKKKTITKKLN